MTDKQIEKYYNELIQNDSTFQELYYEKTINNRYLYVNQRLDKINTKVIEGVGLTLSEDTKKYHAACSKENISKYINRLATNFKKKEKEKITLIKETSTKPKNYELKEIDMNSVKNIMNKIDKFCREYSSKIIQVNINVTNNKSEVKMANKNKLVTDERNILRLAIIVTASYNDDQAVSLKCLYKTGDYSFFDEKDSLKKAKEACDEALEALNAVPFVGGEMPVIIGPGFGAVIFHEACGHALESTSIINNVSIFNDLYKKQIASPKVTIIDDATIPNEFGTTNYDDQGNKTKKNILIDKGILSTYLTNYQDAKKLNIKNTSSARRESYHLAAASRMNNTYLLPGNDTMEDMLKDIKYGLYAKTFNGGTVSPRTGKFNFTVSLGYIIENGKITKPVKDISIIGDAIDILNKVEMVGSDLELESGICSAGSGTVFVTCGQPTIKVSNILVGGNINEK